MCRFGRKGPEIPLHVYRSEAGVWRALLRVNEVRELHRVAHKEHRGVVSDHVENAVLGVELQCKAADVAPRVRGAKLAGNGGETSHHAGLCTRLKELRLCVLADVAGYLELAEGALALSVRATLRNALAVEMGELLN